MLFAMRVCGIASGADVTVAAVAGRRFAEFDKAWEVVVLGIIGQCFGSNNTINGARFVDKSSRGTPMCRLEVWMSSEDCSKLLMRCIECPADKADAV